jgi:hypothetical protein
MADPVDPTAPYTQFQQDQQANKRAALSAMATGGTAARQDVENAQQQIQANKASAVQRAALESQQFNAPVEAQQVVGSQIAAPYDQANQSLLSGQAARAQDMGTRSQGNDEYFGKLDALIPAYQAKAKTAYDQQRAKIDAANALQAQQLQEQANEAQQRLDFEKQSLASQADDRAWQQAQAEREFQYKMAYDKQQFDEDVRRFGIQEADKLAAQRASASRGGGGGGGGSSGYGGTGISKTDLKSQFGPLINQLRTSLPGGTNKVLGSTVAKVVGIDKLTNNVMGNTIGNQLGLSSAQTTPLMPKYSSGLHIGTPTNQSPEHLRQTDIYTTYKDLAARALNRDPQAISALGIDIKHNPYPSGQDVKAAIVNDAMYDTDPAILQLVLKDVGLG